MIKVFFFYIIVTRIGSIGALTLIATQTREQNVHRQSCNILSTIFVPKQGNKMYIDNHVTYYQPLK